MAHTPDNPDLTHEPPERIVLTLVYDKNSPDYTTRIMQQSDYPNLQYSSQALMPVLCEALVGLIHAQAHYGYMNVAEALHKAIHYLEDGTFEAFVRVGEAPAPEQP